MCGATHILVNFLTNNPNYHRYSLSGWVDRSNPDYDYALIVLSTPDTKEAWLPFGWNSNITAENWNLNLNGFAPGPESQDTTSTMWHSYGPVVDTARLHFDHEIDVASSGMQSGSGVYLSTKKTEKRVVYGVQSAEWAVSTTLLNAIFTYKLTIHHY